MSNGRISVKEEQVKSQKKYNDCFKWFDSAHHMLLNFDFKTFDFSSINHQPLIYPIIPTAFISSL